MSFRNNYALEPVAGGANYFDGGVLEVSSPNINSGAFTDVTNAAVGGSFVSGTGNAWTGMADNNLFSKADTTAGIWISTGHGTAFGYQLNYSNITFAADSSALINPAAA